MSHSRRGSSAGSWSTSRTGRVSTDLGRLYGTEVVDFQIVGITYSDSFRQSADLIP
jgi:hypothetical protein